MDKNILIEFTTLDEERYWPYVIVNRDFLYAAGVSNKKFSEEELNDFVLIVQCMKNKSMDELNAKEIKLNGLLAGDD